MLQTIVSTLKGRPDGLDALELARVILGRDAFHPFQRDRLYRFQEDIRRGLEKDTIKIGRQMRLVVE